MASTEGAANGALESSAAPGTFPAVEIEKELNPGLNNGVEVDPVSSQVAATLETKEEAQAAEKKRQKDAMQTLKTAIIISGAIVAVVGAAFAITKKLREK